MGPARIKNNTVHTVMTETNIVKINATPGTDMNAATNYED